MPVPQEQSRTPVPPSCVTGGAHVPSLGLLTLPSRARLRPGDGS